MNTNHSPLPWRPYNASGSRVFKTWRIRGDADDSVIAIIPDDSRHSTERIYANAQYIVQACNAHPALVDALEAIASMRPPLMTKEQEKAFEYHPSTCDAYRVDMAKVLLNAITEARAALALARGGKGGK